jgi:hypothetical protein
LEQRLDLALSLGAEITACEALFGLALTQVRLGNVHIGITRLEQAIKMANATDNDKLHTLALHCTLKTLETLGML